MVKLMTNHSLQHPLWIPLFVKGGNSFARFLRFTRLHVILQRKIDIFFHGAGPKFFNQSFRLCERARSALQNRLRKLLRFIHQISLRDNTIYQADFLCTVRVD